MVETPYALTKYIAAISLAFNEDEREDTDFLFNLETITAFENLDEMAAIAKNGKLNGIVFGRVDFSGSLGLGREGIHSDQITNKIIQTAKIAKNENLDLVVGGAVAADALGPLAKIRAIHLNRFETRKVVFAGESLEGNKIEAGLKNAVHFELLWLQNKKNYYSRITSEDDKRIEMLDSRWKVLNSN